MNIVLGAMEKPLKEQLVGYLDETMLVHMDADADAITRLHLRGFLSDSETNRLRKKLMRAIRVQLNQ